MVVFFNNGDFGIITLDFFRFKVPTDACHRRNELVIVPPSPPLLDALLKCSAVEHEGVHWSWDLASVLAVDLCISLLTWSVHPFHHVFDRHIIVLGDHAQWLGDFVFQQSVLSLSNFP